MDAPTLLRCAIGPGLSLLPRAMDTLSARAMLVAIAMQESGLRHRKQVRGPARGWWQFEVIGLAEVLRHPASAPHAAALVDALGYSDAPPVELHHALEHCDALAAAVARLALYRYAKPLPLLSAPPMEAWEQYQAIWAPGKPHPDRWPTCWQAAQEAVA